MKITILPLDSRPCTYDFPRQLAEGCNVEVQLPPRAVMDFFKTPSNFAGIYNWLAGHAGQSNAVIVSVEQLVYGGLLASRSLGVTEKEALRRIGVVRKIKKLSPGASIALTNVVMRTTVSTLKKEDQVWWERVAEYSGVAAEESQEAKERKRQLEAEIPQEVLQGFLAARRRNHKVNMEAVHLVGQGVVRQLVLLQEDSSPKGLHKAEQETLLAYAKELCVEDKVHLHCGTDEAAAALVGRQVAKHFGGAPAIATEWLGGEQPGFVAKYEDRPFAQNMALYMQTCGIVPAAPQTADVMLLVYPPRGEQMDLALNPEAARCSYSEEELNAFCERAAHWLAEGKAVALLDIHHANGGESKFLQRLAQKGLLPRLCGYAGWNTACNALGTLLGQLLCMPYAKGQANANFTIERLLDDWLYQAVVRRRLDDWLAQRGEDRWNIENPELAEKMLNDAMHRAPELQKVLPGAGEFVATLAWPRTFEAQIQKLP